MTAEQILAAYPNARIAVAYTELIICGSADDDGESSWDLMMKAQPPMTLDEIWKCIYESVEDETECKAQEARVQMTHPDYRRYLAGKLGLI